MSGHVFPERSSSSCCSPADPENLADKGVPHFESRRLSCPRGAILFAGSFVSFVPLFAPSIPVIGSLFLALECLSVCLSVFGGVCVCVRAAVPVLMCSRSYSNS